MLTSKLFFVWLSLACCGLVILLEVLGLRRLQTQILRESASIEGALDPSNRDSTLADEPGAPPA